MKTNSTVNYTPNEPDKCKPTSRVVCTYCSNSSKCPNKMPYEPYGPTETDQNIAIVSKSNNLFD